MVDDARIENFKRMTEADPDNELGHFSLGKIYLEAGRFDEAAVCLGRTLGLNAKMSKAYQLLGEAYAKSGKREEAVQTLTRGVTVADEQGDRMPRDAMAELLRALGAEVPEFKDSDQPAPEEVATHASTPGFRCSRCGAPSGQLPKPPFKGALGEKVFAGACSNCWKEWIPTGTKVINELGLVLSTPEGQEAYDQYMVEFLQLDPA
ncbi:MAG: Fe(2+)-trafficking protein [Phycisphaerae bacterium]|jgi:tetratricopeptide (TPR) repeat protein